jgi:tRNA(Arg) A34 adenosine deaminase TadA
MTDSKNQTRENERVDLRKRGLVIGTGIGVLVNGMAFKSIAHASGDAGLPIRQPKWADSAAFIQRAFEMRQVAIDKGDQSYGAIVVRDKVIIGQSWSRVILDQDPTGHAEMAAIRDAARRQNNRHLKNAVLYSSSRPCPMCEAGAYWAGISGMIHGHDRTDAGEPQLCRPA